MNSNAIAAVTVVTLAGLITGSGGWPIKIMRRYQFEHWFLLGTFPGLVIIPWAVTLLGCPHAMDAYAEMWRTQPGVLIKSNLFSLGLGVANILCCLCYIRIGFALTGGILTGIGVSLGVTIPMIFKGSGLFKDAPDLTSPAGLTVLAGVAIMVAGVVLASLAGFGRDRALAKQQKSQGRFLTGLLMVIASGILSCGVSFSFVYSQGPIVSAMKANGAGDIPANFAVWAVGLLGCALMGTLYPVILLFRNRSWGVFGESWWEFALGIVLAVNSAVGIALMGKGMLMLGALGASVGFGIQQATQMLGSQGVGFIWGEWNGIHGTPRRLMYASIVCLLIAAVVMASGNSKV